MPAPLGKSTKRKARYNRKGMQSIQQFVGVNGLGEYKYRVYRPTKGWKLETFTTPPNRTQVEEFCKHRNITGKQFEAVMKQFNFLPQGSA